MQHPNKSIRRFNNDVNISSPSDGQLLTYNGTSNNGVIKHFYIMLCQ